MGYWYDRTSLWVTGMTGQDQSVGYRYDRTSLWVTGMTGPVCGLQV